jgi:REP-associated tyrosine transposase
MNKPTVKHKRKALRLKNFDYSNPNYVYFLTICARHLSEPFYNTDLADEVIDSLHFVKKDKKIALYCFCLMPDHLHMAISPSEISGSISDIIHRFKSFTTQIGWKHGIKGKLWQKSFYDHVARKEEDLIKICEYILANPVRKKLVEKPDDWRYSQLLDPLPV